MPHQEKFLIGFHRFFQLEKWIFIGGLILTTGVLLMIKSFLYWKQTHFGDLDPMIVLRWVVPSTVLIVLGFQVIISSFYLSILTIKRRNKIF
jgi:hypothetical protein